VHSQRGLAMALDPETREHLIATVRRFVREVLVPQEARVADEDEIPESILRQMRELGLFGLSIPEEFGGLGLSMADEVGVIEEMGQTSPAFRSAFGTNVGIGSQGILIDGTSEQKARWLPAMASGEITASFCLTEPKAGSDAASVRTRAMRDGDHYVLTGTKRFITNAPRAGVFTVMARTGTIEEGARGVSAFVVEAGAPGLSLGPPDRKMGQRGAKTCDVIFDGVRVPAENLIGGKEGQGFRTAMKVLDRGRLHISALSVGLAQRLIADALAYATTRRQFGKPIAEFQLVQAMLADSRTEWLRRGPWCARCAGLCHHAAPVWQAYRRVPAGPGDAGRQPHRMAAARAMVRDTAARMDAGEKISTDASCCKLFATEMVGRVADRTVQIFGGAGYIADYGVERFYRDVRLLRLYEGTSQIQQIVIARDMIRAQG
ncbi:acyl-CoA dehydrogenase family protein, partial [Paracoccus sp. PXZ]